jgi:hypothetical protein
MKQVPSDVIWDIWVEITNDISFKHWNWKKVETDAKLRDLCCMMELYFATHRRFMKETGESKEFLEFAMLTINRVMLNAQRDLDISDDKFKDLYVGLTTH